jgi:hypothetical protein
MSGHGNQASQSRQAAESEFVALVEELEIMAGGRSLEGTALETCRAAVREFPRGFKIVARRSIQEADRNPIGLLLWSLKRNQHTKAQLAAERADERADEIPL